MNGGDTLPSFQHACIHQDKTVLMISLDVDASNDVPLFSVHHSVFGELSVNWQRSRPQSRPKSDLTPGPVTTVPQLLCILVTVSDKYVTPLKTMKIADGLVKSLSD